MILIALGANLAHEGREPAETIKHAIRVLDRLFTLDKVSSLYVSPAWPDPAEPPFINAVVTSDKTLPPETVLKALHMTEKAFGRVRAKLNQARTLDLDLLAVDKIIRQPVSDNSLILPHPRIAQRAFVLAPLVQILPDWQHPITNITTKEMLSHLEAKGELEVDIYNGEERE